VSGRNVDLRLLDRQNDIGWAILCGQEACSGDAGDKGAAGDLTMRLDSFIPSHLTEHGQRRNVEI
jgi:hypothetical protein